jgi:ribosomal-protein-serine acetyltransferase
LTALFFDSNTTKELLLLIHNNHNMIINIDNKIRIELIEEKHTQSIFDMVNENRNHLRPWLPFVDRMQTVEFTKNFVNKIMQRNKDGTEYAFVIFNDEKMVGFVGVYNIDNQHNIGEIGYWIIENAQGNGVVTKSCKGLIDFCFNDLKLNRIEIRCGTENFKSKTIPEKLNFTKEGVIRQGELLYDKFIDLNLYSFLKTERT